MSTGLRFTLEVNGLEPETFAVVSFLLKQRYSFPFTLEMDVASDSFRQAAENILEKNATLTVWQGDTPQRRISGIVTRFGMKEYNGWQMCYSLTINPPLWRAGLRQNFRIFQQQDISSPWRRRTSPVSTETGARLIISPGIRLRRQNVPSCRTIWQARPAIEPTRSCTGQRHAGA